LVFSFAVAILIASRSISRGLAFAIFVGSTSLHGALAAAFTSGLHSGSTPRWGSWRSPPRCPRSGPDPPVLDGVTPFPAEFADRYRALGYWEDRPLFAGFTGALARYADRTALVDEDGPVTYRELSERSARLARVLLDLGFGPLDRVIVQLPNTAVFAYLYFALQRIGAAPVLALPGHRKREISQFAEISGARALAVPAAARGFDFTAMAAEVMAASPALSLCLVQGAAGALPDPRFLSLEELLERSPQASERALSQVSIDPADPALFLLSGGTTGIGKLIPRSHNDYLYNSKAAAAACEIGEGDVLLDVLPIEHNLPLGCPGLQGFLLSGGTVVLSASTRPRDVFELIQRHRVTHVHLVPALLIRWIVRPASLPRRRGLPGGRGRERGAGRRAG